MSQNSASYPVGLERLQILTIFQYLTTTLLEIYFDFLLIGLGNLMISNYKAQVVHKQYIKRVVLQFYHRCFTAISPSGHYNSRSGSQAEKV